jgi:hypothetical protein
LRSPIVSRCVCLVASHTRKDRSLEFGNDARRIYTDGVTFAASSVPRPIKLFPVSDGGLSKTFGQG